MPERVCKECEHWRTESDFMSSTIFISEGKTLKAYSCGHPKIDNYVDLGISQEGGVYFAPNFGCILFEPKKSKK